MAHKEKIAGPRVGLALGSGSARGWAHIGVIRVLEEAGIEPVVIAGTSIGSLVGAAYAAGQLDALEAWARSITWVDIVRLMDVRAARGGFISGARLFEGIAAVLRDAPIESLDKPYAAVATDFTTGREITLREGSLFAAARASMALPGLFPPVKAGDTWLVDGGLVNPVPVSTCRALGAEIVIAVNLNGDITTRNLPPPAAAPRPAPLPAPPASTPKTFSARLQELRDTTSYLAAQIRGRAGDGPSFASVLTGAINIMQDRITRSRLAGDPPDVVLTPRLAHIRLLDFDHAAEVIDEGRAAAAMMLPWIKRIVAAARAQ